MRDDPRKIEYEHIVLFGKPALFTPSRLSQFTLPNDWFCYSLRGSDADPEMPISVDEYVGVNFVGTVLMPTELKLKNGHKKIDGHIDFVGEYVTLEQFCEANGLDYPADTRKYIPRPASITEASMFYSQNVEQEKLLGTIGHLRMDFGRNGKGFWFTWFPHGTDELNTPEFKAEIDDVVNELRLTVLKDRSSMRNFCGDFGGSIGDNYGIRQYGYFIETDHYRYCLRCKPMEGDYDAYLMCYDKRAQALAEGRYPYLSDTADYSYLLNTLTESELTLADGVVSDYYNGKYEVAIPRCKEADADGYHQIDFNQPFPLTAHDERYCDPHASALAITTFKWLEGFEDTGTFTDMVQLYVDELSEKWSSAQDMTEPQESCEQSEREMQFG